jgi:hypothetical protein
MLLVLRILAGLLLLVLFLGLIGIIVPLKFLRVSRRGAVVLTLVTLAASVALSLYGAHIARTIAPVSTDRPNDSTVAQTAHSPASRVLNTQLDFENSEFCRSYHCKEDKHWPVRSGDVNHSYNTSLSNLGVEMWDNSSRNPALTGFGLSFFDRDQLSDEDLKIITTLVRSTDQAANHDKTITFIKRNIEIEISCRTCQLDDSANFVRDGDFRLWAGKVGTEQTIIFERVTHA